MTDQPPMTDQPAVNDDVAKVAELVDDARICMFTTMTASGQHVSRPMALQDVEFDGDLWFFAYDDSAKVAELRQHPQVNVAFAHKNQAWTSVSGTAEVLHDPVRMTELWAAPLETWFPDGLDTPGIALIKVSVDTAEWWEASSSTVKRLIGAARAAVTKNPDAFPASNETVVLP